MAEFSIFYSWQSDLPRKLSREVIQYAAAKAIERLSLDASIEDSPRLDHDTKDVSGAPEIAQTIFSKIDQCGIFLADLTFVGSTLPSDGNKPTKKIPNPNVLLELGYAAAKIGWDRIVLVMNSAYGTPDELIFDLRHRRFPLTFFLSPDTRKDVESVTNSLADKLEEAFRSSMQSEHMAVQNAISRLDQHGLQWMNALSFPAKPCSVWSTAVNPPRYRFPKPRGETDAIECWKGGRSTGGNAGFPAARPLRGSVRRDDQCSQ